MSPNVRSIDRRPRLPSEVQFRIGYVGRSMGRRWLPKESVEVYAVEPVVLKSPLEPVGLIGSLVSHQSLLHRPEVMAIGGSQAEDRKNRYVHQHSEHDATSYR